MDKADAFWAINLDDKTETTPMKYSIAEFIADVYQDMKDFLLLYQKNTKAARENAVAECSNLFMTHWGWRIIDVQKAVNFILYKNKIERIDGVI